MASRTTSARTLRPLLVSLLGLVPSLSACTDPNQFLPSYQPGGPQAILGGAVTYAGPLPCTEMGHVLGAAVLLGFDARLLPPPEGLGTTATSLAAVGGDVLFGGVMDRLTFNSDGTRWCPAAGSAPVTVSGTWSMGPLPGGVYEVRGFYDLGGQFDPGFSITKLPHQGDIAGGAIDNAAAVLQGAAPVYRKITVGTPDGMGGYTIPAEGSNVEGVAVTLALPLPLGLPIFYPSGVYYSPNACVNKMVTPVTPTPGAPAPITCGPSSGRTSSACTVSMPSDYILPVFSGGDPAGTEKSLIRVELSAGVAPGDVAAAKVSPFDLPVASPTLTFSWQDVNGDGMLNIADDHVAASTLVPSLFPLSIFSKLASTTDDLTAQASPAVIIQGLTIYKDLLTTVLWSGNPPAGNVQSATKVIAGIVPAVLCLDPTDFSANAVAMLVVSNKLDCNNNPLIPDEQGTLTALKKQFGRPVVLQQGCLPQGRYAMNLVYGTGQAWSVPNEAGVCASTEPQSADGKQCASPTQPGAVRARLSSEDVVLTIGPPTSAAYCVANPTPPCCMVAGKCTQ